MQASLCFRTAGPNARIQHSPHALCQPSSVLLRRQCHVALNFPPVFGTGLRAGPGRMPINHAIRVHMTPENSIGKKKAEEERKGTVKIAAAAVVIACTLGALCANWKVRASDVNHPPARFIQITSADDAHPMASASTSDPPSFPGDTLHLTNLRPTKQMRSIQALRAVLDLKYQPAVPRILIELFGEAIPPLSKTEWKTYVDRLEKDDPKPDAVIESLYQKWLEKTPSSQDEYEVGLVLIDLLIFQGEYKSAEYVCQKVEPLAPSSDVRAKIRSIVVDLVLDALESGATKSKMKSTVQKLNMLIKLVQDAQENQPLSTTY